MSTPYRPSNGTEGEGFYENWCAHCARDAAFREDPDSGDGCPTKPARCDQTADMFAMSPADCGGAK